MMQILTLVRYYLKRILRRRTISAVAIALPIVAGLLRVFVPKFDYAACPIAFAAFVFCLIYLQKMMDKTSGLMDGFRSAPISSAVILGAQVAAGSVIFAVQIGVFTAIWAVFN